MAGDALTSGEYIKHHLTNLTFGQHSDGSWGLAHSASEAKEMGFWAIHVDTMFWSISLGLLFIWLFRKAAKKATADTPSGLQNFVEWVCEFIDTSVRGSFTGKNDLVAPMALTIFIWVFLMNFMDLVPVDWLPVLAGWIGNTFFGVDPHHVYFKVVSSTDPNATFGMSLAIFGLMLFYSIKIKGIGPWTADIYLLTALRRPDVMPCNDLALAAATQKVKRLPSRPTPEELKTISENWKPWRAVAARILWHDYLNSQK